jgi:hypothetical protein
MEMSLAMQKADHWAEKMVVLKEYSMGYHLVGNLVWHLEM